MIVTDFIAWLFGNMEVIQMKKDVWIVEYIKLNIFSW